MVGEIPADISKSNLAVTKVSDHLLVQLKGPVRELRDWFSDRL